MTKISKKAQNHFEAGRSMVEMLGVLAIVGVLSISAIAGYTYAMDKRKANDIVNEVNKRVVVASTQRITGRTVDLSEFDDYVYPITSVDSEYDDEFGIQVLNVPEGVCNRLLDMTDNWENLLDTTPEICNENNTMQFFFADDLGERDLCAGITCDIPGTTCKSGRCLCADDSEPCGENCCAESQSCFSEQCFETTCSNSCPSNHYGLVPEYCCEERPYCSINDECVPGITGEDPYEDSDVRCRSHDDCPEDFKCNLTYIGDGIFGKCQKSLAGATCTMTTRNMCKGTDTPYCKGNSVFESDEYYYEGPAIGYCDNDSAYQLCETDSDCDNSDYRCIMIGQNWNGKVCARYGIHICDDYTCSEGYTDHCCPMGSHCGDNHYCINDLGTGSNCWSEETNSFVSSCL